MSPVADYLSSESLLLQHVARFDHQMEYLHKLINQINVTNLTQENVSCLNTTLVFLMFANQKSALPRYLRGLTLEPRSSAGECSGSSSIMKNFR